MIPFPCLFSLSRPVPASIVPIPLIPVSTTPDPVPFLLVIFLQCGEISTFLHHTKSTVIIYVTKNTQTIV